MHTTQPDWVENGSKNHSGINPTKSNKVVPMYACTEKRPRCLVYLLDIHFFYISTESEGNESVLFVPRICSDDSHWYECAAVGKAKLCTFSLRATGASALFNAGVPERLIRDVTGHKSNALHLYERPTEQQKKQVSAVLVKGEEFGKECACSYKCNPAKKFVMVPLCAIHFSLVLVTATLTIKPQNFS